MQKVLSISGTLPWLALFLGLATPVAFGQSTFNYGSTIWNNSNNWTPVGVPTNGASVVVDRVSGGYVIDYGVTNATVLNNWSSSIGANLTALASTATNGSLTIGGTLTKTGGGVLAFRANGGASRLNMTIGTLDFTAASAGVVSFGGTGQSLSSLFITNANVSSTGTANQLVFLDAPGASNYTIGTLTLGSGGAVVMANGYAAGNQYFLNVGSLNGSAGTVRAANGGFSATTTVTLNLIGTGNGSYAGVIEDGAAVTAVSKSGSGTQTLSGANSYTGGTTLAGGTLRAGNNAAFGTGTLTLNGGTLASDSATTRTITNAITLGGNVSLTEAATGTGELFLNGPAAFGNATRTLTVAGANAVWLRGALSGVDGLTKAGSGYLFLAGSNSYTIGTLAVQAGTVGVGNMAFGRFSSLGITTADLSGQVALTGTNGGTAGIGTLNMNSGSAALVLLNGGSAGETFTVNVGALNGSTGTIRANNEVGSVVTTLAVTGNVTSSYGGSLQDGGGNTMHLLKSGTGTLTLSGANSYSGGTTLSNGVLRLEHANAAGTGLITQSSGASTLQINTTGTVANAMSVYNLQTLQTVTLSGNKTLNNATYNVTNGTTTTDSGVLSGGGGITKLGTGTLLVTASNTFTGTVDVQAGLLSLASATGSAAGGTTNVIVAPSATLLIAQSDQVNNAAPVTLSGGTIQRASGVSEVFGTLNVSSASFLDFGSGTEGTLSFGTYTASALLTVNNFFQGNVLTFGTDLSGSINNTNSFKFDNAFTSSWDTGSQTFTITAIPEPSTYAAAAGLLGLLVLSVRRRAARGRHGFVVDSASYAKKYCTIFF